MNLECKTHNDCVMRIYWSPIIVGVFVALGLSVLFNVLTLGIGLSAATKNEAGAISLVIGSFIWLSLGTYITLFLAGWVAGAIAKYHVSSPCQGILYGFLVWSVALVICIILSSSVAGSIVFTLSKMANFLSLHGTHKIGIATLSAFFILLMGALGSCFGGYFGIKYCEKPNQATNPKK